MQWLARSGLGDLTFERSSHGLLHGDHSRDSSAGLLGARERMQVASKGQTIVGGNAASADLASQPSQPSGFRGRLPCNGLVGVALGT